MKKLFFIGCLASLALTASAESVDSKTDDGNVVNIDSIMNVIEKDCGLHRLSPKYLSNYYTIGWGSNWFVGIQAGGSCFVGNPAGCGDMFDRSSFTYGGYIGKWHSPFVGTRLVYQGGKFKDMMMESKSFNAFRADFLYNVTNHLLAEEQCLRRWDVIPYLGVGLINGPKHYNSECGCDACTGSNNSFMLSYGIQGRYRATKRLYLTAEIGGMSTFSDFDNYGSRHSFGDGLFSASLGLSVSIGRNGWKHPVDAKPYMVQNDYLLNNYDAYRKMNLGLLNQHKMDANTIEKLRAVLEAEGLMDQYGYLFNDKARTKRNYYQGILSLRSRLMDAHHPVHTRRNLTALEGKDSLLNAPVYFFFKIGKAKLTDRSQLVNLDEIARIAKEHNLILRIDGAADKATGSVSKNKDLSKKRCQFIWKQLRKRGINADCLKPYWHGGVDEHDRNEEDRNSRVTIFVDAKPVK